MPTHSPIRRLAFVLAALPLPLVLGVAACGGNSDEPYKPTPAWSGKKPNMPAPPTLPNTPIKAGDAFTVFGATHHLRSLVHQKDVTANPITITGYIVESNIGKAPDCAIHPTGKKDKDDCVSEIPSFWIADTKGDTKGPKIRVIGWARNFAIIYDAIKAYDKLKEGEQPKEPITDDVLNVPLPYPLPAVGAKVKVTGKYGVSGRNSGDLVSDPMNGVMMQTKIEFIEKAPEKAAFAKKI
jgi:hypothetical protein